MIKFFANTTHFYDKIEIFARHKLGRYLSFPQELIWERVEEDTAINPEPLFRLEQEDAQSLMDTLWDVGLRPSEGMGSAGQLAAVQNHLKDMQTIAFHYLEVSNE